MLARLVLLSTIVAAFPVRIAARSPVEDVLVPGGVAAFAAALGVDPVPDRARFVAELTRLPIDVKAAAAFLARRPAPADQVPVPLSAAVWSEAVFNRSIRSEDLLGAIITDRRATFLCHGLAALDDETLEFFAGHPALLRHVYETRAGVFAAFGSAIRIAHGRIVMPGGDAGATLWEAALDVPADRPERFIQQLLDRDGGRPLYLYDALAQLDAPKTAFALGLWIADRPTRTKRFEALLAASTAAASDWQVPLRPFTRPLSDVGMVLARVRTAADGSPVLGRRLLWERAFERGGLPEHAPSLLKKTDAADADAVIDAAWLAAALSARSVRDREDCESQLSFGQRVFAGADTVAQADVLVALRAVPRYRMLMLTLERAGVSDPAVYASAARLAQRISSLGPDQSFAALSQFQGAVAIVARMARVRSVDASTATRLIASLAGVPLTDGRYSGGIARWITSALRPTLSATSEAGDPEIEGALLSTLAGPPVVRSAAPALIAWEGQQYRFDLAGAELRRLRRIREKQGGLTLDAALGKSDSALGEALLSIVYAIEITDPDGPILMAGNAALHHDFGVRAGDSASRTRAEWSLPKQEIWPGLPWHVSGSLLGLDVALAPLALRRVTTDHAAAPLLPSNERETFAVSAVLMNPVALTDADRDLILAAIDRGRARIGTPTPAQLDAAMTDINADGWRRRAGRWMLAHAPEEVPTLFSLTELARLGGGASAAEVDAWGMSALTLDGCLCTRFAPSARWTLWTGHPQLGLTGVSVADLNIQVATMLREMHLPAGLTPFVLTAAVQDFIDEVRPTDPDDWLTLVRSAQQVSRDRVEDYVAAAAATGPLMPVDGAVRAGAPPWH